MIQFDTKDNQKNRAYKKIVLIIVVCLAIIVVSVQIYRYIKTTQTTHYIPATEQMTLTLCVPEYYGKLTQRVVPVQRYGTERQKADILIEQLKKGGYLPEKLVLLDFAIDDNGVLYMNFTKDITGVSIGTRDVMTAYTLINSFLLNFKNARTVFLLADGQPLHTLGGIVYTYIPLGFNQGLLED